MYRTGSVLKIHAAGMKDNGSVAVYNLLSQVISKGTMTNGQAELACASQRAGIYMLKIESNNVKITQKVLLK